jgi:hypothetical protein
MDDAFTTMVSQSGPFGYFAFADSCVAHFGETFLARK